MSKAADMSIPPSSRVARSEAIVFTDIDETIVMMDVDEGHYYELDRVGARVWRLVESAPRVAELCEALAAEYEVTAERCREDVEAFLDELNRLRVVQVRQSARIEGQEDLNKRAPSAAVPPRVSGEEGSAGTTTRNLSGGKATWTAPTIRVMSVVKRTASGDYQFELVSENPHYRPKS